MGQPCGKAGEEEAVCSPYSSSADSRGRAHHRWVLEGSHRQGSGQDVWGQPGPGVLVAQLQEAEALGHHCSSAAAARCPSGNVPEGVGLHLALSSASPAPAAPSAPSILLPPGDSWSGLQAAVEKPGPAQLLGLGREKDSV